MGCWDNMQLNITCLKNISYAQPLLGYIFPLLFIIILATNCLAIAVFSKPHMRNASTMILAFLAISEIAILLFPTPWWIYMYTFDNHAKPISSLPVCYLWRIMNISLPFLFSTVTRMLTLVLVVEKYVSTFKPTLAVSWCTQQTVMRVTGVIIVFSTLFVFLHQIHYVHGLDTIDNWEGQANVTVCTIDVWDWLEEFGIIFYNMLMLFLIDFIVLRAFPYATIITMSYYLVRDMTNKRKKAARLKNDNQLLESDELTKKCNLCQIVLIISLMFVAVDIYEFFAIIYEIFVISELIEALSVFHEVIVYLTYPVKVLIYGALSKEFLRTSECVIHEVLYFLRLTDNVMYITMSWESLDKELINESQI